MFSRLRDKYDILEEQIQNFGTFISEKLKIDEYEQNSAPTSVVY